MIPKLAHFYWYGDDPLPRLRQECVNSFKRLNPDWIVVLHRSGENPNATLRERVIASDAARYGILSRAGGIYFDTDIAFVLPIPDRWLDCDLLLPCDAATGALYGVHCLGCKERSQFMGMAVEMAQTRLASRIPLTCDALGTALWGRTDSREEAARMGDVLARVLPRELLPFPWPNIERVWSPDEPTPRDCIGVHWYGGDRLSEEMQDLPLDALPDCPVKRVLEMTHARA